ncbi:MAG: DUF262 domain-containing protein [Actinomycetota bacterium]|nr:DUF262 domain-containing protein [Actinomycetota bacterium]
MSGPLSDITARPISLSSLLDGIDIGTVVLPDFQRDFDWNTGEVASLVATLLCGWPAGSLLLMRGSPRFFATRQFEYAPKASEAVDTVVLDGQQRLTSLYLALRNRGPVVYVLNYADYDWPSTPSAERIEERITTIERTIWDREYSLSRQAKEQIVPFYALSSAPDFFEWRDGVVEAVPTSARFALSDQLGRLYRGLLGTINHYDFPGVIIDSDLPSEAVARIFERINRSGRRLNTFDLLVARAYAADWNLRSEFDEVRREHGVIERFFGDDGLPILQVIALHDRGDVRQPALLDLSPTRVREDWSPAVAAMLEALAAIRSFGVDRPDWLPYKAQLLTLGGLAWDLDLSLHRKDIEAWFWGSSLSGAYDVGSSTKVVSDERLLRRHILNGGEPEVPTVAEAALREATRRRSPAIWRTFMAALTRFEAADPLTGELLDHGESEGVLVSLFPKSSGDLAQRVLATVKVSRSTALLVRGRGLVDLLSGQAFRSSVDSHLQSQFLPPVEDLLTTSSEELLAARLEMFLLQLRATLQHPVLRVQRSVDES